MAEHVMALRAMTFLILYCQIIPMFHNFDIQQDVFKVETMHDHDKGACHESPFRDFDFDCCVFVFTGCYATKRQLGLWCMHPYVCTLFCEIQAIADHHGNDNFFTF